MCAWSNYAGEGSLYIYKVQPLQHRGDVYLVLATIVIQQNDIISTTSAPGQLLQWDAQSSSIVKMSREV